MDKTREVTSILEAYFGESLEASEQEKTIGKSLYEPLCKIEAQRDRAIALLRETFNPWREDDLWTSKLRELIKEIGS